jgi:hypothetical protein
MLWGMRNPWAFLRQTFIRSRIGIDRWWLAAILIAIAAWATPMSPTIHWILAIIAWGVALPWLAVCVFWDFFRWHWPFLPKEIEDQITNGLTLLSNPNFELADLHPWQQQTRDHISKIWSLESRQFREFEAMAGIPVPRTPDFHRAILIKQINVLKQLDPTWP